MDRTFSLQYCINVFSMGQYCALHAMHIYRLVCIINMNTPAMSPVVGISLRITAVMTVTIGAMLLLFTSATIVVKQRALAQFTLNNNNNNLGFNSNNNQSSNTNLSTNLLQYTSPNLGFSIRYPADSQVKESSDNVRFISPGVNVLGVFVSNSRGMQLNNYSQNLINYLIRTFPIIYKSSDSTLTGYPSHFIILGDNRLISFYDWTVIGTTVYTVELIVNPANRDSLALIPLTYILNSFHLVNQQ